MFWPYQMTSNERVFNVETLCLNYSMHGTYNINYEMRKPTEEFQMYMNFDRTLLGFLVINSSCCTIKCISQQIKWIVTKNHSFEIYTELTLKKLFYCEHQRIIPWHDIVYTMQPSTSIFFLLIKKFGFSYNVRTCRFAEKENIRNHNNIHNYVLSIGTRCKMIALSVHNRKSSPA